MNPGLGIKEAGAADSPAFVNMGLFIRHAWLNETCTTRLFGRFNQASDEKDMEGVPLPKPYMRESSEQCPDP